MIGLSITVIYFFVMSAYYWNKSRNLDKKVWEHYETITKYKIMLSQYSGTIQNLDMDNKVLKDQNHMLKANLAGDNDFQYESSIHKAMIGTPYINPNNNPMGK